MDSYTLLPADSYIVYNKTILNDFDKKILISFYEPIIGHLAISIYLTLWNDLDNKQISRILTHHHLMSILKCPLKSIKEARESLESVGLLKTYVKSKENNNYVYELYSPLSPNEFFNHPILSIVLYNNLGSLEYEYLKNEYKQEKIDLKDFVDITKKIDEVYDSTCDNLDIDIVDRNINDLSCNDQVDFALIKEAIPKELMNEKALTKKIRELINELAFIYKLDTMKMIELIRSVLNNFGMIDKNDLRIAARRTYQYDNNALPTLVYRSQPEYLKAPSGDSSMRGKIIQMFETLNPVDFLRTKNRGIKPTKNEMKIIEMLIVDMEMSPAVVNVLIDYVLRKNNNKLVAGYVEAIASQWKRANLKTATEAMDFAIKENKRMEKKTTTNIKEVKEPVWFNKNIESANISKEEQQELENLLKEFK